jgi:hypothetical protein
MKRVINIIIAILILLMMIEIEKNSISKMPDYSNAICLAGILFIFGFIRIYYQDFKNHLLNKK